jgi:hypothetical protein
LSKAERTHAPKNITVRYPIEVNARIYSVHEALSKRAGDVPVQISHVMNRIALAGLPSVEKACGITKQAKK